MEMTDEEMRKAERWEDWINSREKRELDRQSMAFYAEWRERKEKEELEQRCIMIGEQKNKDFVLELINQGLSADEIKQCLEGSE